MTTAWEELTGQEAAIAALRDAAADPEAMTHSWLITGPPGSGRSNLAFAFATALLQGSTTGAEAERTAAQVAARTHPDLAVLATDRVLERLGLGDAGAEGDLMELRELLRAWRDAKTSAWKALVDWIVRGALALLLVGIAVRLGGWDLL